MTVYKSKDWHRINNLPRRDVVAEVIDPANWESQNEALTVLKNEGGLLGGIPVGGGKTRITAQAPRVTGSARALLLVPAPLVKKTARDFAALGEGPEVRSHAWASRNELPSLDLLIIDEAHEYGGRDTARGRRLIAWRRANPSALCAFLSGSLIEGSIRTIQFLSLIALKERSPFPIQWSDAEAWAAALDARPRERGSPGALLEWSEGASLNQVRRGVLSRLRDSPGVYMSEHVPFEGPLSVRWIEGPEVCRDVIERLHESWEDHTGRELAEPAEVWARVRQAELGYGYRTEPLPPDAWLAARSEWVAFVRSKLGQRYKSQAEVQAAFPEDHARWLAADKTYTPRYLIDWLDTSVMEWAWRWARLMDGLVWVEHARPQDRLQTYYGANDERILDASGPCFASRAAHGVGKNLVQWNKALVLTAPSSGRIWEQMIGRLHRAGQTRPVEIVIRDSPANRKAVASALKDANFNERGTAKIKHLLKI